jgi:hypothetical protein
MAREQNVKTKASLASTKEPETGAEQASQPVQTTASAVPSHKTPTWPTWPTSRPGPRATPSPVGMHTFSPFRAEQVSEVGYNQETGTPGTDSIERSLPDESKTGPVSIDQQPDPLGKRKQRL